MAEHKIAEPVQAYPCFGIYADYDANAPDTATCFLVATEDLAKEVCDFLNEDARSWNNLAFVDGWEFAKSFQYCDELTADRDSIFTSLEALKESDHLERDEDEDEPAEPG